MKTPIQYPCISENQDEYCEECRDTGFGGDMGPGVRGNREYGPCSCDQFSRIIRKLKRENL